MTWSADQRLTYSGSRAQLASLAFDASALHVVWSDRRSGNSETYYKRAALWTAER